MLGNQQIENVTKYKYLGIIFQASGSFSKTKHDLYNKGLKAFFKLRRIFSPTLPNITTLLHIFDHTIIPILLYGCEIWGYFSPASSKIKREKDFKIDKGFDNLPCEGLHLKFCKFALGVKRNATNYAVSK
jgi:hypothetical protein